MAKIGVLLSGCGVFDGAEIHEAVLTLLALSRAKAQVVCLAPDVAFPVVDHLTKKPTGETRNVLAEAARIARGKIKDAAAVTAAGLDALILPGGSGASKNLCDFASKGAAGAVHPAVAKLVSDMHAAGKPIGAICIAPVVLALILGREKPALTIGNELAIAQKIEATGARHENKAVDEICVDEKLNLVTTPAYMLGPGIADIAVGIDKLVAEVLARAGRG